MEVLSKLARGQFGLVAVWQAEQLGVVRQTLARRAAQHGWQRVGHGIYLLPGHPFPPIAQVKAIELALQNNGLASHRTAAFVWGLLDRAHRPIEFLVPADCSRRPIGAKVRTSELLPDRPGSMRHGIAVTPPDWTACSLSAVLPPAVLTQALAVGHRKRLFLLSRVRATLSELAPFTGCGRLRAALAELDGQLTHSRYEAVARWWLEQAGLMPLPKPHVVQDERGLVAELDIAFLPERVGIPVDGPHHFFPGQKRFDDDQRHRLRLAGWMIVPVDALRLEQQPQIFVRQVREALAHQRTRGSVTHA